MSKKKQPLSVGWREVVAIPEWGVGGLIAKIDTGARTSAIHVESLVERADGGLEFVVPTPTGRKTVLAEPARISRVKPSTGEIQERWVVETTIEIGPMTHTVEISLSSRAKMLTPMLIGRRGLKRGVVVNPHRRYLHGKPPRAKPAGSKKKRKKKKATERSK